jgi:hypothetical protein
MCWMFSTCISLERRQETAYARLEPNFINEGSVHGGGIQYGIRYTRDFYTIGLDVSIFGTFSLNFVL